MRDVLIGRNGSNGDGEDGETRIKRETENTEEVPDQMTGDGSADSVRHQTVRRRQKRTREDMEKLASVAWPPTRPDATEDTESQKERGGNFWRGRGGASSLSSFSCGVYSRLNALAMVGGVNMGRRGAMAEVGKRASTSRGQRHSLPREGAGKRRGNRDRHGL